MIQNSKTKKRRSLKLKLYGTMFSSMLFESSIEHIRCRELNFLFFWYFILFESSIEHIGCREMNYLFYIEKRNRLKMKRAIDFLLWDSYKLLYQAFWWYFWKEIFLKNLLMILYAQKIKIEVGSRSEWGDSFQNVTNDH